MTQIELETRLSEIEANYASRISDHNAEILNQKIHIEQLHAEHDMAVSKAKQQILTNFSKSVKERTNLNSFEATYYSDIQGRYSDEKKFDVMEQKSSDISQSMEDWKSQLEASNKANENQIDEPTKEKSASKNKEVRE